jgi:hypothetical protein
MSVSFEIPPHQKLNDGMKKIAKANNRSECKLYDLTNSKSFQEAFVVIKAKINERRI